MPKKKQERVNDDGFAFILIYIHSSDGELTYQHFLPGIDSTLPMPIPDPDILASIVSWCDESCPGDRLDLRPVGIEAFLICLPAKGVTSKMIGESRTIYNHTIVGGDI